MWLLTSILSALFFAIASFIITIGTKKNYSIAQMLLGLYISGSCMFGLYLIINYRLDFNYYILLWGIIIGIGSSLSNALFSYALKTGPVSLTAPLVNSNVIIVIAMSVLYFGETISLMQAIAIILLISACFILPFDPDEKKNIRNKIWFIIILFTIFFMFLLNGGLKITQELNLDNSLVLFYSYIFSTVFFLISSKYLMPKQSRYNTDTYNGWQKKAINIGLFAGLFSFLGLQLYAYALEIGPASIIVPIFSSRNVIVTMLCLWYFKENLSKFQRIALGSLLGGLFLVNF